MGGAEGFLSASEDAYVAALEAQRRRVRGHVGPGLVDDGHHSHGDADLSDGDAFGSHGLLQHPSHGILQGGDVSDAFRHVSDAPGIQLQPVQHDLTDRSLRAGHVLFICLQYDIRIPDETLSHGVQGHVLRVRVQGAHEAPRRGGVYEHISDFHVMPSFSHRIWCRRSFPLRRCRAPPDRFRS